MSRLAITNIPHTAATDHRIRRGDEGPSDGLPQVGSPPPNGSLLVDYHRSLLTTEDRQEAQRDLGIALAWLAKNPGAPMRLAKLAATQARPLLVAASSEKVDDPTACQSLGVTLDILGQGEEALRAFQRVLSTNPQHELALRASASLAGRLRQLGLARTMLEQTVAVNPFRSDYRLALAKICIDAGDWPGAIAACRESIRLNPDQTEARSLLVRCLLRSGDSKAAHTQFEILLCFSPASREIWQQWYEQEKQSGPSGPIARPKAKP